MPSRSLPRTNQILEEANYRIRSKHPAQFKDMIEALSALSYEDQRKLANNLAAKGNVEFLDIACSITWKEWISDKQSILYAVRAENMPTMIHLATRSPQCVPVALVHASYGGSPKHVDMVQWLLPRLSQADAPPEEAEVSRRILTSLLEHICVESVAKCLLENKLGELASQMEALDTFLDEALTDPDFVARQNSFPAPTSGAWRTRVEKVNPSVLAKMDALRIDHATEPSTPGSKRARL